MAAGLLGYQLPIWLHSFGPFLRGLSFCAIAYSCCRSLVDVDSAKQYPRLDARCRSHGARNLRRQPRYDPERAQFQVPIRIDYDQRWETRTYNLDRIRGVDLFLSFWGPTADRAHDRQLGLR